MVVSLSQALDTLQKNEAELRRRGVLHAAVFGSVARSQETASRDIDVLIEIDPNHPIGLFEYAGLKLYIGEALGGGTADVVNRKTLKPLLRDRIEREAIYAF